MHETIDKTARDPSHVGPEALGCTFTVLRVALLLTVFQQGQVAVQELTYCRSKL